MRARPGCVFDPVAAATVVADLAVSGLLNRERAARLVEFHARESRAPGFDEVVAALISKTWDGPLGEGCAGDVTRAVQWLVVTRLIGLAGDESADPRVRAVAAHALGSLVERIDSRGPVSRQARTPGPSRRRSTGSSPAPTLRTGVPSRCLAHRATRSAAAELTIDDRRRWPPGRTTARFGSGDRFPALLFLRFRRSVGRGMDEWREFLEFRLGQFRRERAEEATAGRV